MYKFNNNSIFTFYLKGKLHDFNLPSYEAWTPNKFIYKNNYYIYKNYILKALEDARYSNFNLDNFKVIQDNYVFGNKLLNITKNLNISSLYYDAYTHNYLGRYLRFYRDYMGIDLMPLYNCFSEETVSDIVIKDLSNNILLQSDDNSTIYMVDAIPFTEYTFYINCKNTVEIAAGYYDNGQLDINNIELPSTSTRIIFPYEKTYYKKTNTTFNKPFIYDKIKKADKLNIQNANTLYQWRDKFKIFVKVPKNNESPVVILEGDYLQNNTLHFENTNLYLKNIVEGKPYIPKDIRDPDTDYIPRYNYDQSNKRAYIWKNQLTCIGGLYNYPFSDRLIEYLIHNTIDAADETDNNIARVQDILTHRNSIKLNKIKLKGVWDADIRNVSYGIAKNSNLINTKYDVLGYIDKDVEDLIKIKDGD